MSCPTTHLRDGIFLLKVVIFLLNVWIFPIEIHHHNPRTHLRWSRPLVLQVDRCWMLGFNRKGGDWWVRLCRFHGYRICRTDAKTRGPGCKNLRSFLEGNFPENDVDCWTLGSRQQTGLADWWCISFLQGDCGVLCHGDLCLCFDLKANHLNRTSFGKFDRGLRGGGELWKDSMRCLAGYLVGV